MRAHTITTKASTIVPGGILALGLAVVLLAATASTASAEDPVGRTEGDARAAFNAVAGAGFTIADMGNPHNADAPPTGGIPSGTDDDVHSPEDVRIYPGRNRFSYCASGWHVIFDGWWDDVSFHDSYEDLRAYLNSVDVQFEWDGVPLVEERTAIKQFNFPDPDYQDTFFVAIGTFMPPGSLSVGKHRLTESAFDPLYPEYSGTWSVTVNILPC